MKTSSAHSKKFLAWALMALLLTPQLALANTCTITRVDNYGGSSNVYTDKPNTTIRVTSLDENGNPVESWVGTTDSNGRITIQAGYNLSKPYLRATVVSGNMGEESLVLPSELRAGQPFTFAATGAVRGEVIRVQTLEGEVVAERKPDEHGRVYLASGLAAGTYVVGALAGKGQPAGQIVVKPKPEDALVRPGDNPARPLKLYDAPNRLMRTERATLHGEGFSPNAADMMVNLGGEKSGQVPVLSATAEEIKLGSLEYAQPGLHEMTVTNKANGETSRPEPVFVYDARGRIIRHKLANNDQTQLEIALSPKEATATVLAKVQSGPVHFAGGSKETTAEVHHGVARIPVEAASAGVGPFQLDWALQSLTYSSVQDEPNEYGGKTARLYSQSGNRHMLRYVYYDANGRKRRETTLEWTDGGPDQWTSREWDANGRETSSERSTWSGNGRTSGERTYQGVDGRQRRETWDAQGNQWVPAN